MAQVELRNVKKSYGKIDVIHDFNLVIEDKEFIVFVGPSGCGKTTTLRMVAGLEEISGGQLYIDGTLVNDVPAKDRNIAMVFQNYALYPHMTVYDNMAFGLKMRKMPKTEIDKNVKEAAKILDLEPVLNRKPKALSGGQRQRVALGRAIVRKPKVFLMDEPLSNLDAKLRVHMRAELIKLHEQLEATVIYVTHDQTEAMTMGDRIVVMKDGYIQQVDTPLNLYNRPVNMFVAGFIGSPAMNFIPVTLREQGDQLDIVETGYQVAVPAQWKAELANQNAGLVLGVRPENIELTASDKPDAIKGLIEFVEPMGAESFVYLKIGEHSVVARVQPEITVKSGDQVGLTLTPNKLHLFDANSEKAMFNGC